MGEPDRRESGLRKLNRFIRCAKLPYAQRFLDLLDLSGPDKAALARASNELYRPTVLDSERALLDFEGSHSRAEIDAFSALGNRLVESHSQFVAVGAWTDVFRNIHEAPPSLGLNGFDAITDFLRVTKDIGREALDADFLSELDPLEGTHAQLASTGQWHHLRSLLQTIEARLGPRREEFLAWARSVEPGRAEFLVPLADLENS